MDHKLDDLLESHASLPSTGSLNFRSEDPLAWVTVSSNFVVRLVMELDS